VVPDLSQPSCHGVIRRFVFSGSVMYSDDWLGDGAREGGSARPPRVNATSPRDRWVRGKDKEE
jgi:hypothetical protein